MGENRQPYVLIAVLLVSGLGAGIAGSLVLRSGPALPHGDEVVPEGVRRESEQLDGLFRRLERVVRIKEAVTREVIAGRLTLPQAAERFRRADLANPTFKLSSFRRFFAGVSDEERRCRQVIARVRNLAEGHGDRDAADALPRLEAELERFLSGAGAVNRAG